MFEGMVDRAFSRTNGEKTHDYSESESELVPPDVKGPTPSLQHAPTKP
jgi:hypothetical protein